MPDREQIHRDVMRLVAEIAEIPEDRVTATSTFKELGIDSLNGLRIAAEMEVRFGINIPDEVITKIGSLADVLSLADRYIGEKE